MANSGEDPPVGQSPAPVQLGCGHIDATLLKHTVDILVRTVKFELVKRNTETGLFEGHIDFEYVPYVDGSINLELSAMVLGSPGTSPRKKVLETIPRDVEQELSKKPMSVPIKFHIAAMPLKEPYKVRIKTEAKQVTGQFKVCQLTLAVIENVNRVIQIRVTDQIVWVNQHPYICHDSTGIFKALKALNIVNETSKPICSRCLVINNTGVLDPIGNIIVTSKIGSGSHATVFNGTFQNRPCAVKRYPITNKKFADNDIKMMKDIGSHSNIVSYYGMGEDAKFVFVAVESCKCSLDKLIASRVFENDEYKLKLVGFEDLVLWKRKKDPRRTEPPPEDICKVYPSEHLLIFLRGIVSGLSWLHSRNISHNNLKIQNVLINRDTTAKLSTFSISTIGVGSSGGTESTFFGDLNDLGNLLLECITITRDGKTMSKKTKKINWVTHVPEAHDLITQLQHPYPKLRPTAAQVKMHPFFWGPREKLDFLYYASECVQAEEYESKIRKPIFEHQDYKGWDKKVDTEVAEKIKRKQDDINKQNGTKNSPSYHGVNLLRTIRNNYSHYRGQTEELQSMLGKNVTEFDDYFSSRFPNFFMLVYNLFKYNLVKEKNLLDEYLKHGKI